MMACSVRADQLANWAFWLCLLGSSWREPDSDRHLQIPSVGVIMKMKTSGGLLRVQGARR